MNHYYSEILIGLADTDLATRERLIKEGILHQDGYHPEMRKVHKDNYLTLEKLIQEFGFPTLALVGTKGHDAAWLIIQHSIDYPKFMRKMFQLMKALPFAEISQKNLAYLADRIQFYERKPQKYGTQFDWSLDGNFEPWMLKNEKMVDTWRKEVDLPPLLEVKNTFLKELDLENAPSKEEAYNMRIEMENWLVDTGWCTEDDRTVNPESIKKQ